MDTSSVINGYVSTESVEHFTVPEVVEEAKGLIAAASIGVSLDTGSLKVWEASPRGVALAEEKLKEIGGELSETDIRVVALALDLRERGSDPVILSDDYGLQNLAEVFGLEYSSVATRGIRSVFKWKKQCPACKRKFPGDGRFCPVCGTKLRRIVGERH